MAVATLAGASVARRTWPRGQLRAAAEVHPRHGVPPAGLHAGGRPPTRPESRAPAGRNGCQGTLRAHQLTSSAGVDGLRITYPPREVAG